MNAPLLSLASVSKTYRSSARPHVVLHKIDLTIQKGMHLGLIGQSGAGKSTLARLILGLEPPDGGVIRLNGTPIHQLGRDLKQRAQIIFQDPTIYLNPYLTVLDLVAEPLDIFHRETSSRQRRRERAIGLIESVGLNDQLLHRRPHELSGGQCQRVAIARALAPGPALLICDEPFTNIDPCGSDELAALVQSLAEGFGVTCLLISHDLSLIRRLCVVTAVLQTGRIIECGPTNTLFSHPSHAHTRALVTSAGILEK